MFLLREIKYPLLFQNKNKKKEEGLFSSRLFISRQRWANIIFRPFIYQPPTVGEHYLHLYHIAITFICQSLLFFQSWMCSFTSSRNNALAVHHPEVVPFQQLCKYSLSGNEFTRKASIVDLPYAAAGASGL